MKRPIAALAGLLALAACACGYAQGHGAVGDGGTLVVLSSSNPDSIDPAIAYTQMAWQLLLYTNDGLVDFARRPPATGVRVVADLARAVPRAGDGGRTYVFRLRREILFSNGRLLRPADVRASFERLLTIGSPGAWTLSGLVGAAACSAAGPSACDLSRGVEIDEQAMTVSLHLTRPDPDFLRKLALPFADVLPATAPRRSTGATPLEATGPYRIERYRPGREIVLVRNSHYRPWSLDAQPPGRPGRMLWRLGGRAEDEVNAVQNGQADYVLDPIPADRLGELSAKGANLHIDAQPALYYMFLNTRVPPFDDVRVRRALNLATDRGAVARLYGGSSLARPACQLIPPGIPGFAPFCPYSARPSPDGGWHGADMAGARALVEASHTRGQQVTVWSTSGEPGRDISTYFVSLLHQLGYRSSLKALETGVYFATAANSSSRAQMGFWNWYPDYPEASDFFRPFTCESFVARSAANVDPSSYCNARLDATVREAARSAEGDPARSQALYAKADHAVTLDAPFVPLFTPKTASLLSPGTRGYRYSDQGVVLLDLLQPH